MILIITSKYAQIHTFGIWTKVRNIWKLMKDEHQLKTGMKPEAYHVHLLLYTVWAICPKTLGFPASEYFVLWSIK